MTSWILWALMSWWSARRGWFRLGKIFRHRHKDRWPVYEVQGENAWSLQTEGRYMVYRKGLYGLYSQVAIIWCIGKVCIVATGGHYMMYVKGLYSCYRQVDVIWCIEMECHNCRPVVSIERSRKLTCNNCRQAVSKTRYRREYMIAISGCPLYDPQGRRKTN